VEEPLSEEVASVVVVVVVVGASFESDTAPARGAKFWKT